MNNTIADNDSLEGSGVFAGASATLWNNNIAAGAGQIAVFCSDEFWPSELALTFRSNDVFSASGSVYGGVCTDQTGLNGNISVDPLFVEPATNDYHLLPNSPCIDAGDDTATGLPATRSGRACARPRRQWRRAGRSGHRGRRGAVGRYSARHLWQKQSG